jgi:predicted ribosome quality control (RQC) complex YloA/Tae2 family protein
MSFDGVFLYHLTPYLISDMTNARCEGFFYDDEVFYIQLYHDKRKRMCAIDLHANQNRIYLIDEIIKPKGSHPLLIQLNHHLSRSVIKSIKQYKTDRVLTIELIKSDAFAGDTTYELIIEFMGKHANMILVQDKVIIEAYKRHMSLEHRSILPKATFSYFPSSKKDLSQLKLPLLESSTFYESQFLGLSLKTAVYMIEAQTHPFDFNVVPTLYKNAMYCFSVNEGKTYETFYDLMQAKVTVISKDYEKVIDASLKKAYEKYQKLIFELEAYSSQLPLKETVERIYQEFDIHIKKDSIDHYILDETLTLHENAQHLSKQYVKAKRAIPHLQEHIQTTKASIDVLEELTYNYKEGLISKNDMISTLYELKLIKTSLPKEKHKKITHHTCTIKKTTIVYGKNAFQNNYVTHQLADKNDLFIHVKDAPGAHVILKGTYDDETFMYALKLAAFHSKLKLSSSIPVMYTKKSNVSKIPGIYGSNVRVKSYQTKYIDIEDTFKELCE